MKMSLVVVSFFLSFIPFISAKHQAFANWNIDTVQTLGGDCLIRDRRIDETKLSIKFFDFSAALTEVTRNPEFVRETCSLSVEFNVPAGHRLKTLTHRILATVNKGPLASFQISSTIGMSGLQFQQLGQLPLGIDYQGRLLLYKSFPLSEAFSCESFDRSLLVNAEIVLELSSEGSVRSSDVIMTGDDEGTDVWIETERC